MRAGVLAMVMLGAVLAGCRSVSLTPDECWHTYARYFNGNMCVPAERPACAVDIRRVPRQNLPGLVKDLTAGGFEQIGRFDIADGTDVSANAVDGLARYFKAEVVLWSAVSSPVGSTGLVNGDLGIPGVEASTTTGLYQRRPDEALSELTETSHVIVLFSRKAVAPVPAVTAPVVKTVVQGK